MEHLGTVRSGESFVDVYLDQTEDGHTFVCDLGEWKIAFGDVETELSDLTAITAEVAALISACRTELLLAGATQ